MSKQPSALLPTPPANSVALSPLQFLERAARVFPHREAVIEGDRRLDYSALGSEVHDVARALAARIGPGDRVAILSVNTTELLVAHFAVPLARGVLVPINTRLSVSEIAYIIEHSGAQVLVLEAEQRELGLAAIAQVDRDVLVIGVGFDPAPQGVPYGQLREHGQHLEPLSWDIEDETLPISINYTSGTTGRPKGVVYNHRGAYLNSLGFLHHSRFDSDTSYLWTLPMFHCNGWCTTWAVTAGMGRHVVIRAVREDLVWDAIDRYHITHLCGAPTVLSTVANASRAHQLSHPLRMISGAAPPSPAMIAALEKLGIQYTHAYGLTESYGPFTLCEYQPQWDHLDASERASRMARQGVTMLQSQSIRVVDESMDDVPADGTTIGEIVMRGNNVMVEYFADPEATAQALRGGWLHTGDLGVMHDDGYIEVRDRAKDVIISGGENITSIEVENALLDHTLVDEAAVVGVASERWGERPVAYITSRVVVDEAELIVFLRSRIAHYKVPDRVLQVRELPRTSTGKVIKRELRERAAVTVFLS